MSQLASHCASPNDTGPQYQDTSRSRAPLEFIWMELTTQCNLECIHCYCDAGPTNIPKNPFSLREQRRVIDAAVALGCRQIQFIGGEPTLVKRLSTLIAYARARGMAVEVYTNALHLTADLLECFIAFDASIATSFYCDRPDIHDRITNSAGSHRRTAANIERILKAGVPLRVGIIAMKENKSRLAETERYLRSLGVSNLGVDNVRGIGRGRTTEREPTREDVGELCGHCGDGRIAVAADGTIYPCVMARQWPLASARQTALEDVLDLPALTAFRNEFSALFGNCAPGAQSEPPHDCTPICRPLQDAEPDPDRDRNRHDNPEAPHACNPDQKKIGPLPPLPPGPRPGPKPCFPETACYPDAPCSPKNPCWPDKPPCHPDKPSCRPIDDPGPCRPEVPPPPCTPRRAAAGPSANTDPN